jgi:hypothetical protein
MQSLAVPAGSRQEQHQDYAGQNTLWGGQGAGNQEEEADEMEDDEDSRARREAEALGYQL